MSHYCFPPKANSLRRYPWVRYHTKIIIMIFQPKKVKKKIFRKSFLLKKIVTNFFLIFFSRINSIPDLYRIHPFTNWSFFLDFFFFNWPVIYSEYFNFWFTSLVKVIIPEAKSGIIRAKGGRNPGDILLLFL